MGEAGVFVYTPYLLQLDRGLSPTWAGYFGAIHALTWSLSALCVSALAPRWHRDRPQPNSLDARGRCP